jgi:tetratricopeptide (TPR) repeat protein
MAKSTSVHLQGVELSRLGCAAFDAGDATTAAAHFLKAVELERREAGHRYNLAVALEALGDQDGAAKQYTEGLRLNPKLLECARRLALLLGRSDLSDKVDLDVDGLEAALSFPAIDKELIAQCALRYLLARDPLRTLIRKGASDGWDAIARDQCLKGTGPILRNTLFLSILQNSINTHPQIEHFLTALRRIIALELQPSRFADGALLTFIVALARQCHVNEFVWALNSLEQKSLDEWSLTSVGASADATVSRAIIGSPTFQVGSLRSSLPAIM